MLLPLRKGNEKGEQGRFPPRRSVDDVPSIGCWSGTLLGNFVGHFRRTSYDHRFLSSSSHSPPLYYTIYVCVDHFFFMNRVRPSVRVFPFPPPCCRQPNTVRMDVEEVSRIILLLFGGKREISFFLLRTIHLSILK